MADSDLLRMVTMILWWNTKMSLAVCGRHERARYPGIWLGKPKIRKKEYERKTSPSELELFSFYLSI